MTQIDGKDERSLCKVALTDLMAALDAFGYEDLRV